MSATPPSWKPPRIAKPASRWSCLDSKLVVTVEQSWLVSELVQVAKPVGLES